MLKRLLVSYCRFATRIMAAHENPRTLLLPDDTKRSFLYDKWAPIVLGGVAFFTVAAVNLSRAKPPFSGIQRHIFWTAAWGTVGKFLLDRRIQYFSDRDAILRHYIELHPEDFPVPERKRVGELFKPWHPVR